VVIDNDCIDSCKSNYHTITTTKTIGYKRHESNTYIVATVFWEHIINTTEILVSTRKIFCRYGSLICNYLCNHYLSPLMMWVRCGVRVTRSLVLCVCFIDHCLFFCTFSFGHCVFFSSSIYEFWLPLWYLQSLLRIRVLLIFLIILITGQTAVIFHWII
jgi:hypothetical protein